ncbi:hypothetical protein HN51_035224 [Arachis hypogaea]|uniref:Uncharacterized protein n=1 Tax=Arachis hypogaea TaxID=3818 RepID=A0A445A5J4_ARAHY|nr:glutamic acid-rich protein [Arachis hypogaea]RYR21612.1 hypothetical protein Ahy_B03g066921 [Arachis hypogaea]
MMAYNKGLHGNIGGGGGGSHSHSHRGRPYALMLLIAFGAALLGVMLLHKLRERRIYTLILKDKDHQLLSLKLLLQKERDHTKELSNKNEEMKGKLYALRIQKMEVDRKVVEMQSTMDSLRDEQKVMESAFEEKQNELRTMQEKGINLGGGNSQVTALREDLKKKEEEIENLKGRLEIPAKTLNDPGIIRKTVIGNGTVEAQDQIEKEEHSLDTTKTGDGDVKTEVKDEIQNTERAGEGTEGHRDDNGGGVTTKDVEAEVVDSEVKNAIREEKPGQIESNANAGDEESKVRELADSAGTKKKHVRVSRMKGKRWKTIVKNKLMERNGISASHAEISKGNEKANVEVEGELKENAAREKEQANLLKPENHEISKDVRNMIVNDTNHQVTNNNGTGINPEQEGVDEERLTENNEDTVAQQNWSRRHINKATKDGAQSKSKLLDEEQEAIEISDVQNRDDDEEDNGEFFRDSLSDVEDDKEEYKEEIDESEFQPDL